MNCFIYSQFDYQFINCKECLLDTIYALHSKTYAFRDEPQAEKSLYIYNLIFAKVFKLSFFFNYSMFLHIHIIYQIYESIYMYRNKKLILKMCLRKTVYFQ